MTRDRDTTDVPLSGVIRLLLLFAALALITAAAFGCVGALRGGTIGGPTPTREMLWTVDVIACDATTSPCAGIASARIGLHTQNCAGDACYLWQTANADGYAAFTVSPTLPESDTIIRADGYLEARAHIDVAGTHDGRGHNLIAVQKAHVDPSTFTLPQLAAVRGAMWPATLDLPYGPRPGQPTNILAMAYYDAFSPADRDRMLTRYHDVDHYTHAVTGPIQGNDCYHGKYPCWQGEVPTQAQWDAYLDELQTWWDRGIVPIYFAHPDGWTFEHTRDVMTPLLEQPKAQRVIRFIVPAGWEPTRYGWSSCTWALYGQWARQVLPNAIVALHTVNDTDAPAGTDARCNDDDKGWNPAGNGGAWARVAPYFHVWLIQNGPYTTAPGDNPTLARNFCAQFKADGDGATLHSIAWHFEGAGGWTRLSAWGDRPLQLVAAEQTAYTAFWGSLAEAARKQWGDLAISCGAAGYLDGGTVDVPVQP